MKKYIVTLTEEERTSLNKVIDKSKGSSAIVKRAFALLAADANAAMALTDQQIQERYHIAVRNIEKLRQRFVEQSFEDALYGKKRTQYPEKLHDGRTEAYLLALRCSDPPQGHNRWTLRLLADQMVVLQYTPHISYEQVRLMLKKK